MGFLAKLHDARSEWKGPYSLKDPALARLFGAGYEASSGIVVTEANAFTFSAVFSAVLQISSDVAKLPLNLLKRRKEGGTDHYVDSKTYDLLKLAPNDEQSSMTHRQTLLAHALTCHGGYAEIERNVIGGPRAIWTMTPDRVEPFREEQYDRATGRKTLGPLLYKIDNDPDQILPARDVIHVSGLGYDGTTGYSVINKARQAIGLALAMEKFGGQYFGKGTVFGGWLETDSDLDEEQKKEIKDNIEAFRKAQDSAWRVLVTGAGHKFHQFASKPSESQMDESRIAQVLEVARFFRMPPIKLGVNTPGTVSYASAEAANTDYYVGCLLDWITRYEQELNRKLIPAAERRQQFIKHNATAFLRGDTTARSEFYAKMLDRGVFCADDVLELEDMNPQPNGQGKLYLVQSAQIPKDLLVDKTQAEIDKLKAPPPAPAPPPADDSASADAARALEALVGRLDQVGETVAALGGERQAAYDRLRDELDAIRTERAQVDAELARATAVSTEFAAARDAAVQAAADASAAAQAAQTDRDAMASAAAAARNEAIAQTLAAAESERLRATLQAERDVQAERLAAVGTQLEALAADLAAARAQVATVEAAAAQQATERAAESERAAAVLSETREAAERDVAALRRQITDVEAAHATALQERVATEATLRAQVATAEALRDQLAAAETASATADQQRSEQIAAMDTEIARVRGELAAAVANASLEEARHADAIAALQRHVTDREADASVLQARIAELETSSAQASDLLAGERQARIERMTASIAAHRGLLVDVIGRMARRECQQARAKQATPEKLRRWLEGFADVERQICEEALLPTMRVRMVGTSTTETPESATTRLVSEHLEAFTALVRHALEAAPEDFHADLDRVLTRWETERPGQVADILLEQEVRHVRAL